MEKIVKKYNSFEEAENAEREFWRNASVEFKLKTLEAIRYMYFRSLKKNINGIEKIVKIKKLHEEEQD